MGVYEILTVDREMKRLIAQGAHDIQIEEIAVVSLSVFWARYCKGALKIGNFYLYSI